MAKKNIITGRHLNELLDLLLQEQRLTGLELVKWVCLTQKGETTVGADDTPYEATVSLMRCIVDEEDL